MRNRVSLIAIAVVVLGLLAMSCGQTVSPPEAATPKSSAASGPRTENKWDSVVANARKEGALMVYASSIDPSVRQALQSNLQEKFGITTDLMIAGTGDVMSQKVKTETSRGLYLADAYIHGTQMVMSFGKDTGLLAPLEDSLLLPEVTDPKAWDAGKLPYLDRDKLTMALTGAYWSYILINTDLIKEGDIKSYRDLLLPQWKGKMIMGDPSIGGAAVNWVMFVRTVMGVEEGEKYLRQLAGTQDLVITRDNRLQAEWVARGKMAVAIAPSMGIVAPLIKAGAPVSWIRVSEGGLVHPSGSVFGLASKAPHPNAAKVLLNWLLTAEGQRIFAQAFGQPPIRQGVAVEGIDPFTIPRPGEKVFLIDEKFIVDTETIGRKLGQEIFGGLLK